MVICFKWFFCFINFCLCRRFWSCCNWLELLICVFSFHLSFKTCQKALPHKYFFSSGECLERVYWTVFLLLSGVASCSLIFVFSALLSGSWVLLHISWVYCKFFFKKGEFFLVFLILELSFIFWVLPSVVDFLFFCSVTFVRLHSV